MAGEKEEVKNTPSAGNIYKDPPSDILGKGVLLTMKGDLKELGNQKRKGGATAFSKKEEKEKEIGRASCRERV